MAGEIIGDGNPGVDTEGTPPPQTATPATAPAATPQTPAVPMSAFQPTPPQSTQLQQGPGQTTQAQPVQQPPVFQPTTPESSFHAKLFDGILKNLGGGDVRVMETDPTTGQSQLRTIAQPRSQFAKNIVAAALTGLFQKPQYVETKFGPVRDIGAQMAEGFQAGAGLTQQRQERAQQLSDEQRTRAMQTIENNLKLHQLAQASSLADYKSGEEMVKSQSTALEGYLQAEKDRNTTGDHPDPQVVFEQNQTADQAMAILQKKENFGNKQAIIDGIKTGPDGKPMYTYSIVASNVDVPMNSRMQEALTALNPDYAKLAPGTKVPLYLVQRAANMEAGAANAATQLSKYLPEDVFGKGGKPESIDADSILKLAQKNNDVRLALDNWEQNLAAGMGHHDATGIDKDAGAGPEDDLDSLIKDPRAEGLLKGLGIDAAKAAKYIQAQRLPRISAAAIAKEGGISDKAPIGGSRDEQVKDLNILGTRLGLEPAQIEAETSKVGPNGMTIGEHKEAVNNLIATQKSNRENAIRQQELGSDADVETIAHTLVDDPTNLTTLKALGGNRTQRIKILAAAERYATSQGKKFDEGLIEQRAKFLGEYENPAGRAAINRQAINNISTHAANLAALNNQDMRLGARFMNTPLNEMKSQFGNQVYAQYRETLGVLRDELNLYFAGGYAPTGDQLAMWNKILAENATPQEIQALAKETIHLSAVRAKTFNSQFKTNMGYNDPNMITPDAQQSAAQLGMGREFEGLGSGGVLGGNAPVRPPKVPANYVWNPSANQGKGQWQPPINQQMQPPRQ
jgi:hypothetical protein